MVLDLSCISFTVYYLLSGILVIIYLIIIIIIYIFYIYVTLLGATSLTSRVFGGIHISD